jgi:5-methylcytosine-specific restriction endonuclease McrA
LISTKCRYISVKVKKPKKITKAKLKSLARTAKRKALSEWSKAVRDRDGNKCAVCGKTEHLNAHHLIPKERFCQYQFEISNGIAICSFCHKFSGFSAHRHPIWFAYWLQQNRPEQYRIAIDRIIHDLGLSSPRPS